MRPKLLLAYLAAAGFLALFLAAGVWQLGRAQQKEALFAAWAQVDALPTLDLSAAKDVALNRETLLRVAVRGRYLSKRNVLLDNQQRPGQVGVMVYTPFAIADTQELLLVARGFLPIPRDRSEFPDPQVSDDLVEIRGLLTAPPAPGYRMGQVASSQTWPRLLTAIDTAQLSEALGQTLLPGVLLLDPQAPEGFLRDWHPNTLSADRHRGYAVQWLGLALTVLIVTLLLTARHLRRHKLAKTS
jgi:cytochrome oxidase assembly protein ShyY1